MADGTCNVGLGMRSDRVSKGKVNLKKELDRIIQEHPQFKDRFQQAEALEMPKGWGLPMGSKQQTIAGDGFLLLGDAAALIDPFTGEGIGNGMPFPMPSPVNGSINAAASPNSKNPSPAMVCCLDPIGNPHPLGISKASAC